MVALYDVEEPRIVAVGKGIVSRGAPVAVFVEKRCRDFHGFARRAGALHHAAAKKKADAALDKSRFLVREFAVKGRAAAVGAHHDARFVGKPLVEG